MRWLYRLAAAALTAVLLRGCGEQPPTGGPATTRRAPDHPVPDREASGPARQSVDEILALPYAGWVQEDMATADGLVFCDQARSYAGYTLFTVRKLAGALLVDHAGAVVHQWRDPDAREWQHVELLPGGELLVIGVERQGGADTGNDEQIADADRYLMRLGWEGAVQWKRRLPVHHAVAPTPDGNLMVLAFQRRRLPAVHPTADVRDDMIMLLTPQGDLVGQMSFYDTVRRRPDAFPLLRNPVTQLGKEPWVDLFHANSLEWMHHRHLFERHPLYGPDNVLVCFRHQHRIAVFDMRRGEVVWAWGLREVSAPHDAQVLEDGRILLFDNGVNRGWSRVIEVDPLSGQIVWEFKAPTPTDFYTASRGSAQRLPNGNTLIANSDSGEIFEVTRDGDVVWRYLCPERNERGQRATIVRARRFENAFIERLLARTPAAP